MTPCSPVFTAIGDKNGAKSCLLVGTILASTLHMMAVKNRNWTVLTAEDKSTAPIATTGCEIPDVFKLAVKTNHKHRLFGEGARAL